MGYMKEEVKRINRSAEPESGARPNAGKDFYGRTGFAPGQEVAESRDRETGCC